MRGLVDVARGICRTGYEHITRSVGVQHEVAFYPDRWTNGFVVGRWVRWGGLRGEIGTLATQKGITRVAIHFFHSP